MKVRFTKNHKQYRKGDFAEVTPNVGFGLVDSGVAVVHKMIEDSVTKRRKDGTA